MTSNIWHFDKATLPLLTFHLATSEEHWISATRNFSFNSSTCLFTVTVSSFSRSTIRPNFCIIILLHVSFISPIFPSKSLRSLWSFTCLRFASLKYGRKDNTGEHENGNTHCIFWYFWSGVITCIINHYSKEYTYSNC